MKYTKEQLARFVDAIQDTGINVSKWEADFVASVGQQLTERGTLSEKQIEILDRIYSERTP